MKATFENSVDVLVKAYLNDELQHADCMRCAVGNLVQASHGDFEAVPLWADNGRITYNGFGWPAVFCTIGKNKQVVNLNQYRGSAKTQIDSTGYSVEQLIMIERAFESFNPEYNNSDDEDKAMFDGLMAVVDVLAEIHNIDLTAKESAKKLFVKP